MQTSLEQPVEILIVDDSRVQAKVLKDLLQSNGYTIRVATNGQEALQMVREQKPTLIISDIVMPLLNGYDMCRTLKQDEALKTIPVVLLTSLSDIDDILLGLNAQADYYLTKPYSPSYLLTTIEEVLRNFLHPLSDNEAGMEVTIGVKKHIITANRRQMLSLLLSTYGNAVEQNRALLHAQHDLKMLNEQLREQSQRIEAQQIELQEANRRLHDIATHDGLTGLKNHRAFKEKLEEEMQRSKRYSTPLSLILLDVDSFKQYNDTYGHPAGDEVLKTLAKILLDQSRATDMVARYGGEEFAVLMPNTDSAWAISLAERLRTSIEQAPWPQRPVTASFGISTFSAADIEKDASSVLIEAGDQALYHSKRTGRNRVTHASDTNPVT
jgi:diguanylate cyclase (GGDEF)-like protein